MRENAKLSQGEICLRSRQAGSTYVSQALCAERWRKYLECTESSDILILCIDVILTQYSFNISPLYYDFCSLLEHPQNFDICCHHSHNNSLVKFIDFLSVPSPSYSFPPNIYAKKPEVCLIINLPTTRSTFHWTIGNVISANKNDISVKIFYSN